jgi:hypothetical protein
MSSFSGTIGYIIGKKKRMMNVNKNGNLLWQILVREIYILMKHYKTIENLQQEFINIKITKDIKPSQKIIEKCKIMTNLEEEENEEIKNNWSTILYNCQYSYINMLKTGYILNKKEEDGYIFMLDFNKKTAFFFYKGLDGKQKALNSATIKDIMDFEDMPTNSLQTIYEKQQTDFTIFYEKLQELNKEINVLNEFKEKQDDENIINKLNKLLDEKEWQKKQLYLNRKMFFNHMKMIHLIEEETSLKCNKW